MHDDVDAVLLPGKETIRCRPVVVRNFLKISKNGAKFMPFYDEMPTPDRWLRDTSSKDRQGDDPVLTQIDSLVYEIHCKKPGYDPAYLYGELYCATNYWLREFKLNPRMKTRTGLESPVRNLLQCAVNKLAQTFKCHSNSVPTWLEDLYGKNIKTDKWLKDLKSGVTYMNRSFANEFRVFFVRGLAYQFDIHDHKLKLADSAEWYDLTDNVEKKRLVDKVTKIPFEPPRYALDPGWGMFVMSMSRDIYLGPHMEKSNDDLISDMISDGKIASFHSSWLGGTLVHCAGTMLIEKGVVKGIRNNSGHYEPPNDYMVNVLELLRTVGANLKSVEVYDFEGFKCGNGEEFLNKSNSWSTLAMRQQRKRDELLATKLKKRASPPG